MIHWLIPQLQTIKLVLSRMRLHLLSTMMISLVIGVAACLPALFYLGVDSLSNLTNHIQNETEISLFLKLESSESAIAEINTLLSQHPDIKQYRLVKKEEAWAQLQERSEANADGHHVIQQLNQNPLPDAFFIQAKTTDPEALETLKNALQGLPGVEQALLNTAWAKRLDTLLALGKKIILLIASMLAIALLVIIGNTVRMQVLTQKDEIEVSQLMGATNNFIKMPFLYAGVLYGLFGGLLSIVLVITATHIFNQSIVQISNLYGSDFHLVLFNSQLFLALLGTTTFLGWLGAYVVISRALTSIQIN